MSEIEQALASIWREVIRVSRVRLSDDFFDLGGHSVLMAQVISRVRHAFGVELQLRDLFEAPTLVEFAHVVESHLPTEVPHLPEAEFSESVPQPVGAAQT